MDDHSATPADRQGDDEPSSIVDTDSNISLEEPKPASPKKTQCLKPDQHKKIKKSARSSKKAQKSASDLKVESSTDDSSDNDTTDSSESDDESSEDDKKARRRKVNQHHKAGKKAKDKKCTKSKKVESDDSDSSEDSASEDSSEDDFEDDKKARKRKARQHKPNKKTKDKKRTKSKKIESDVSDSSESGTETVKDGESSSENEDDRRKRKKKAARKSKKTPPSDTEISDVVSSDDSVTFTLSELQAQIDTLRSQKKKGKSGHKTRTKRHASSHKASKSKRKSSKKGEEGSFGFQRVDQVWDTEIHNFKLKESTEDNDSEFSEYAFLVRRTFDYDNKYQSTYCDIKAKQLRAVLLEVMKDCKSTTLEAEEPSVDPKTLFLYLDELRAHYKKTLRQRIKGEKKRKSVRNLEKQRATCKTLVAYLDEEYAETNKTLKPLLAAGNITFDLLWALYKPNEVVITSCYGSWDDPRCFKVDWANKFSSITKGEWYSIEGKYLEYDGRNFGFGDFEADVEGFKGPRKITNLSCYPLKYHTNVDGVKKQIVERGKNFVQMEGMNYRFHKGMAFLKKKKIVAKINVNSRIMIDPGTFRRINPNYPISIIKPHEADDLMSDSENEDPDCSCCEHDSDEDPAHGDNQDLQEHDPNDQTPKMKWKLVKVSENCYHQVQVEVDENGMPIRDNTVHQLEPQSSAVRTFTDDELLLASPVVLGFAFNEKLWLEFSLSGVRDIEYNENAFESLVLPASQKSIVRALVESHKFHGASTIDDVVQGKGKGLVAVLHGPPGTGKTLTAEGISELLRCPLYMISCGELGTDAAKLEHELQRILDIAHSWGAVLLLDEADVFLEKRVTTDLHRNSLVSVFLRLLEYFQGILFLTTNRVETFDDAFASRIHVALRYGDLTGKAKKTVWKTFIDLCRAQPGHDGVVGSGVGDFSDRDFDMLSRAQLNGRQIKNAVRTAQALALNEGAILDIEKIKRVMEVTEDFDRDLKGGPGYSEAMRSYT